jgi:hypothetical protein
MPATTCIAYPASLTRMVERDDAPGGEVQVLFSVGRMGVNRADDVRAIQGALSQAPVTQGGAMPPLKIDGICGPVTVGAIQHFQLRHFGRSDQRVDPNGPTLARLNELGLSGSVLAFTDQRADLIKKAVETIPVAAGWISASQTLLLSALGSMDNRSVAPWPTLNVHFHLDKMDAASLPAALQQILAVYMRMNAALSFNPLFTVNLKPVDGRFAEADGGGFYPASGKRRTVIICPPFGTLWIKSRTAVVVHELAHLVGGYTVLDSIKHYAMELPAYNGTPQDGCPRNYADLTPAEAMRNAASYATFAIHAAYSFDNRAGWT